MVVMLLALPALRADDKPADEKKPPTAKQQFDALVKDFNTKQQKIISEYQKLKGQEQQKKLQEYFALGGEFADKFLKIAEDNPKEAIATDALFWIVQNDRAGAARTKALKQINTLIAEMPLKDLSRRLKTTFGLGPDVLDAVFQRAQKETKSDEVGDLYGWIVQNGAYLPVGSKAIDVLVEQYPEHSAIEMACQVLGRGGVANAAETLQKILEKSTKPKVKAAATLALGQSLAAKVDTLGDKISEADKVADQAEHYFVKVVDDYGKDFPNLKSSAEKNLKSLRFFRVGKTAPDIAAGDLDKKDFKLSDYRGKVVLLDFWELVRPLPGHVPARAVAREESRRQAVRSPWNQQ